MTDNETISPPWGCHFNEYAISRRKKEPLPGCPSWATWRDIETWCEKGIIVWSDISKRIESLSGTRSLELLKKLETSNEWEKEGIVITQRYLTQKIKWQAPRRKTKKGKNQGEDSPESATPEPKPPVEEVEEEIVRLPPEAGTTLLALLKECQQKLEEMAEAEEKDRQRRQEVIFKLLLEMAAKGEIARLDIPNRPFPWEACNKPNRWICQQPPNWAVIFLSNEIEWHACIKRNGHYWKSNIFYLKLTEAFQWVENELLHLQSPDAEPDTSPVDDLQTRLRSRAHLLEQLADEPTSIQPEQIEPENIRYQVFIEIESKPETYKTQEDSCGEPWISNEQYLSQHKMAALLNLDPDRYTIEPKNIQSFGWYRFLSVVNYHMDSLAIMQAQKAWEECRVMHEFKTGRVIRARYGYCESETGYSTVLGSCDAPDKPWEEPESRAEHMAELAAKETLCLRLNVEDYRTFMCFSRTTTSDQRLLYYMHKDRAKSKFASEDEKRESRIWLAEHVEDV